MRIGEVAKLTGLNISNVRFYERKGLLSPDRREDSNYREYTDEDVLRIREILLYRKMGISVETISLLLNGEADRTEVLKKQKLDLKEQIFNLQGSMELCDLVLVEESLDADKLEELLNYVHEEEEQGKRYAEITELFEEISDYTKESVMYYRPLTPMVSRWPWAEKLLAICFWIGIFCFPVAHLIDVYRGTVKAEKNFIMYATFISFFPQLVAGPIVRANTFIPQLHKPFFLGRRQFGIAIFWILNGLAKKFILSDYIAVNFVDRVFTNPDMYSGFETLWALFGYSLQVYADFSGYTDIATGVAMLMGFYLPMNFNSPYKAPNPGNFWKRWHVSLSQWLQHYLYIPLGGNREASFGTYCCILTIALIGTILSGNFWVAIVVGIVTVIISVVAFLKPETRKKINTNLNRMNTMLLGGLWHGASWNFMIWGGLNGLGMVVFEFWKNRDVYVRTLVIMLVALLFLFLDYRYELPAFRIGLIWTGAIFLGTFLRMLYNLFGGKQSFTPLEKVWAIGQTFVFVTFTRLFFRSGSNLDPAEANKAAWNTTKTMIEQLATAWNTSTIGDMLFAYRFVFGLIIAGLIIHWLPTHFKRWYRINFALLPLPVIALLVAIVVFVVYQFKTADLQAFIYFQF